MLPLPDTRALCPTAAGCYSDIMSSWTMRTGVEWACQQTCSVKDLPGWLMPHVASLDAAALNVGAVGLALGNSGEAVSEAPASSFRVAARRELPPRHSRPSEALLYRHQESSPTGRSTVCTL
jgi:hypothetical protein